MFENSMNVFIKVKMEIHYMKAYHLDIRLDAIIEY